ncbi:MFS transporter, partial [Limibacillus halophilus]
AAVGLMSLVGWRESWLAYALFCLFAVLPLLLWLAAKPRVPRAGAEAPPTPEEESAARQGWTRGQVLRDPGFYLLLPALFASPCLGTGLFFHQVSLVEAKGWALTDFAAAFPTFAVATSLFGLWGGRLVDARSARWLLRVALWPMAAGFALIGWAESPLAPHGLMILMGATVGFNHTISTALWAELYGLAHLGAIRALSSSFMVFSTALGPAAMGLLLDSGLAMSEVMLLAALWVALTAALQPLVFAVIARRRPELAGQLSG